MSVRALAAALPGMLMSSVTSIPQVRADVPDDPSLTAFLDLAETRNYTLGRPVAPALTPDGSAVLFLRAGPRDPVLRLHELDTRTGREREVLAPHAVLEDAGTELSDEEKARRERMRQSLRGFTSFELSRDGSVVLVPLAGRLVLVERATGTHRVLPGEGWLDPHLSPDGRSIGAVQGGELWTIDTATGAARRLTSGATPTLVHGEAEFVAQEEMGRFSGFWWSPDSRHLVYQETDLSPVQTLYIADPGNPQAPPDARHYPRAGTPNARVRVGVVPRDGGDTTWLAWDGADLPYLARVVWDEPGAPLTLVVQSRDQRRMAVLAADPTTGSVTGLLTESDDAWLDIDSSRLMPWWLPGGQSFLWSTERDGGWHLELRSRDGRLLARVTQPDLGYRALLDVDPKSRTAVVLGGPDPREQHLYRVTLEGSRAPEPLTRDPGLHTGWVSRDHRRWVVDSILATGEARVELRTNDGRSLHTLRSLAERPPRLPEVEWLRTSGDPSFDAVVVRPRDAQPGRRYPVLLYVYGGPTHKVVGHSPRRYFSEQWMADQGFVVVSLDGRGTPGHGHHWARAVRGNLIDVVLQDQVAGLRAIAADRPELDLEHVAIAGWSFGGYLSAMATIRRPDVFRCGVAGAPVTDWADYDTHYTERYLDTPQANPEGYLRSSVLTWVPALERPLLLMHGVTDDNVFFVHTLKLARAAFDAGRAVDVLPLAGTHMISGPAEKARLWQRMMQYIRDHI